jgi:phosphate starvation-inducible protein PhoH and related proteins
MPKQKRSVGKSERIASDDFFTNKIKFSIKEEFELLPNHKEFLKTVFKKSNRYLFIDGPAGTGKTYLCVLAALRMLKAHSVNELLYVRSATESASKSLGSLPGDLNEKFLNYTWPLLEKLDEFLSHSDRKLLLDGKFIEACPVNFLRGRSLKDTVVIVDEAQNLTIEELVTTITRISKGTKYLIIGDTKQTDIKKSGYRQVFDAFSSTEAEDNGLQTFTFTKDDVVRDEILKFIFEVCESKLNVKT